jgi:O-antigen/teichoic acid export membrane protein
MNNIFASIQSILLPTLSEFQDDRARVNAIMRRSTKMSCFVIYPLMVGMIVIAEPMVNLLLGDKWLGAIPFIQIMCVANFFRPITISNWEAIKALGYSGITLKLEVIKKIVDTIILLVSINFGVQAIAWGMVLFNFMCVFINLTPNIKLLNYKIHEQILDAVPTLIISAVMGVIISLLRYVDIGNLSMILCQIAVGVIVYIFLCHKFKEESYIYLLNLIKTKLGRG